MLLKPHMLIGKVGVLQELSKHGISLNEKDAFGNSPATRAAGKGHIGVIRELVKHRDVDLNACDGLDDQKGFNPPTIAVVQGQVDMVAELSRQGVNLGNRCLLSDYFTCVLSDPGTEMDGVTLLLHGPQHGAILVQSGSWQSKMLI